MICKNTDHAPEDVSLALDKTLRDLQLDYVDLYLFAHLEDARNAQSLNDQLEIGGRTIKVSDTLFTWPDLQAKLNSELFNNLGNFINRVLSFIVKPLGGMMSLVVKSKIKDSVKCEVVDEGELKSRRHLNVRGKSATLPSITVFN